MCRENIIYMNITLTYIINETLQTTYIYQLTN